MNEGEFREIIDDFFKGKEYFEISGAHIWIAKHGQKRINRNELRMLKLKYEDHLEIYDIKPPYLSNVDKNDTRLGYIPEFETLTIEPNQGGQYEVAVRIWSEGEWKGYKINDFDSKHFLVGINTRGH